MNPLPCPRCSFGGETVKAVYIVTTEEGSYCRCQICGHVWHVEFQPPSGTDYNDGPLRPNDERWVP